MSSRYIPIQEGFWWKVKIGDGNQKIGKCFSETDAQRIAAGLETAFQDGKYVGAASRDAEIAELQKAIDENWVTHQQIVAASKERDQLRDEVAELVEALKPFGAIDLVESRLPAEFAMLILRARAAIAKVRKP